MFAIGAVYTDDTYRKVAMILLIILTHAILIIQGEINVCIPSSFNVNPNYIQTMERALVHIFKEIQKDIINIDRANISLKHPAITFQGEVSSVKISNLSHFEVCLMAQESTPNDLHVLNISFAHLNLKGNYNLIGNIGDLFDIYGTGTFWLSMQNFSIASTHFNASFIDELCTTINIDLHLNELKGYFTGLMNGDSEMEPLFNKIILHLAPIAITTIWNDYKDEIDQPLEEAINKYLHRNTSHWINSYYNVNSKKNQFPYCVKSEDIHVTH